MAASAKEIALPIAVIAASLLAVFALSSWLEKQRPPLPHDYADSDLALQGKKLKGYALGAEGLMADWYWILSLQYLGGKIVASTDETINVENLGNLNPRLLHPYLDNATELDPKFTAAYSFGAIILPAIDQDKAIALTEKGIRNNPENWRLYQYLGYIHWRRQDFDRAAQTYDAGSKIPGAPPFMRQMVAAMKTKGGDRDTARLIYGQMLADAEDEQSKRNAQIRLDEIDSIEEREAVDKALSDFKQRTGRCVTSLAEIFPALLVTKLPSGKDFRIDRSNNLVDPTGIPYVLDAAACKMSLANESKIPKVS